MASPKREGQIVTFYSYKGGTGRTMLLANVAWILASRGKRVLMIDWDLEAPGLHHYFHPFLRDPQLTGTEGLIDMVVDHATRVLSAPAVTETGASASTEPRETGAPDRMLGVDPRDYVVGLNCPSFPAEACLHMMPAGQQDASYSTRVNSFDWRHYYDRLGGGNFLNTLRTALKGLYEYILVDSRTGVSDTSGVCTVQMPDRLVVCFAMSEANILGGAATASFVKAQWEAQGRIWSGQNIFPIATRVDQGEKDKLDAARTYVRQLYSPILAPMSEAEQDRHFKRAQVLYQTYYAFEEVLAVFGDRSATAGSLLESSETIAAMISNGEVTELAPPSDIERASVLQAYERKGSEIPPDAEWIVRARHWSEVKPFHEALRHEFGFRTRVHQRGDWLLTLGTMQQSASTIIVVLGDEGEDPALLGIWRALESQVQPKGPKRLVVLVLEAASHDLTIPAFLERCPTVDLRTHPAFGEALIGLRLAITGGDLNGAGDEQLADIRLHWHLREAADIWQARGQLDDFLLRGEALAAGENWLRRAKSFEPGIRDFIDASRHYDKRAATIENLSRQFADANARNPSLRIGWTGLAAAAVVCFVLIALGYTALVKPVIDQSNQIKLEARELNEILSTVKGKVR